MAGPGVSRAFPLALPAQGVGMSKKNRKLTGPSFAGLGHGTERWRKAGARLRTINTARRLTGQLPPDEGQARPPDEGSTD